MSVSRVGGLARLTVEDSGPGIAEQDREKVFERFYRVVSDGDSAPSGSGLGLVIVEHIVQLHHATIRLGQSSFASGLAVTVDFPAEVEQ